MIEVEIPGYGTAKLRESHELRTKDSDLIEAAVIAASGSLAKLPAGVLEGKPAATFMAANFTVDDGRAIIRLRRATLLAVLHSWDLRLPFPTTMDELEELPRDVVRILDEKINEMANVATQPDFSPTADKESPTSGSGSLNGNSKVEPGPKRTKKRSPAGTSTGTGKSTQD